MGQRGEESMPGPSCMQEGTAEVIPLPQSD